MKGKEIKSTMLFLKEHALHLMVVLGIIMAYQNHGLSQEVKWIAIGSLQSWYMESGSEPEVARRGLVSDQIDGLRWPAQYRDQDTQAAKAIWIAARNYNDLVSGSTYLSKVVHVGPRVWDDANEFMPQEFTMFGRTVHPTVIVDGVVGTDLVFDDIVDEIDPTMKADRMILNRVVTSIGIEMTRKIYAFSQQYHDDYFIYEYIFKNTGQVHENGNTNPQTLDGLYFHWQYRYSVNREMGVYAKNQMPQSAVWGHNTMNDARGEDPNSGDPFRALFAWQGLHSAAGFNNIGVPYLDGDGRLLASQHVGTVVLHADKSGTDKSNDPFQPTTTQYIDSNADITYTNDQYNPAKMNLEYEAISAGHPALRHADAVGEDGFADDFQGTAAGYSSAHGFGPYTLEVGDSIRIVLAEGVSGLSRERNIEIGAKWLNEEQPYILPDGSTTTDVNEYKNQWVYTGRDSIFQTFNRAIANFNSGFDIPQPPPPPDYFEVASGGDRISLSWSNNAEEWPGFAGYKVYRAIQEPDTTYELLATLPSGTLSYDDTQAARGFDYYYFVLAFDDGSTNNIQPGVPLQSSRFWTQTSIAANLKRPAESLLDSIRVVPNPYNIKAAHLQFGTGAARDRILFVGLPPRCTIKIFTERGDLIQTLEHTDGSGDEAWDQTTTSRQIVVSGVYIAYFEVTEDYTDPETGQSLKKGQSDYRKFIIIR